MKNKKGISLIVLVITIIVMIILAASVVISLNNTGVIDKATYAVDLTNEKQVQDLAALTWAEAYLDPDKRADIVNVVKEELEEQGVTEDKWNINVSDTGVAVSKKENTTNENITFTFLGEEYIVAKGTTWYDFLWYGEGENLDFYAPNESNTNGAVLYGLGSEIIVESTREAVTFDMEIMATTYVSGGFPDQ